MKVRFAVSVGAGRPDPERFGAAVEGIEARGFDSLWLSDLPSMEAVEPLLGVAFAAARTRRIRLGVNLIPFGAPPFLVAQRLAHADRLSGGRLLVTLVPGLDLPAEREAVGTTGRHRGRMMDEVVPALRALWSAGVAVPPVQDPLEIWLGGSGPEAVARAGRLADGWLGAQLAPRDAGRVRAGIEAAAAGAGRAIDPEHFGLSIGYARSDTVPSRRPAPVPMGAGGLRRLVGQLVDEGLSKFVLRPVAPVGDWDDELDWLADAVLPLQT